MALGLSYAFDANEETPQSIALKREIMAQLMGEIGGGRAPQNWGEGVGSALSSIAHGFAGNVMRKRADAGEKAGNARADDLKSRLMAALSGQAPVSLDASGSIAESFAENATPLDPASARVDQAHGGAGGGEWLAYANQGATRNQPLNPKLVEALSFLPELGVSMEVFSGGQHEKGKGPRVGSTRHDHGNSADVFFKKDGRKLNWADPNDRPIFEEIVRRGKAAGVTGFGAGEGYMQPGSMHLGFGAPAVWGAGGSGANAPDWLRNAYNSSAAQAPNSAVAANEAMATGALANRLPMNAPIPQMRPEMAPSTFMEDNLFRGLFGRDSFDPAPAAPPMDAGMNLPMNAPIPTRRPQNGPPLDAPIPQMRPQMNGGLPMEAPIPQMRPQMPPQGVQLPMNGPIPQMRPAPPQAAPPMPPPQTVSDMPIGAPQAMLPAQQPPAMPQAAPQAQAMPQQQGGPDLALLMEVVSNPFMDQGTKAFAMAQLQQHMQAQDPAHQLDMEYKRAQLAKLQAEAAGGGEDGIFGTPIYGVDPETKKTVLGAMGKDGKFHRLDTGGVDVTPGVTWQDFGTHRQAFDNRSGAPIGPAVPKENYQEAFDTGAGGEAGQRQAAAAASLPTDLAAAEQAVSDLDALINHPGLPAIAGSVDQYRPAWTMGPEGRDALARFNQAKGRAFLQAFGMLKGGGTVTEIEGLKAEQAMARMDRALSEADFKKALEDFRDAVKTGTEKLRQKAGAPAPTGGQGQRLRFNPATGELE
jgi:hypothetical protein